MTPVYPVNPCGPLPGESCTGRRWRDNPAFSAQGSQEGQVDLPAAMIMGLCGLVSS